MARDWASGGDVRRRKLGFLLPLVLLAVSAYAMEESVTVQARWRVLPYQTLRVAETGTELSSFLYTVPPPTALDRSRGYIEDENAARLRLASNTAWKIQVEIQNDDWIERGVTAFELRQRGDEFLSVSEGPQVLARGSNGVYELDLDYRVSIDAETFDGMNEPILLLYTIMSE